MKNNLFATIVTIVISVSMAIGQNNQIDSLLSLIETENDDTTKVITLNALSAELINSNPQESIIYGEKAKSLSEQLNYATGLAYALKNIGMGYYYLGDYLKVFDNWQESLNTFELLENKSGTANLSNNLGATYFNQGDNAKAIEYYLKSLQISEDLKDKHLIATALVNIGSVYSDNVNTHDDALKYYWLALPLGEEIGSDDIIGTCTDNIGEIYLIKVQLDSAQFYFEKSLAVNANTVYLPHSLNLIGKVFEKKGDYKSAIQYQNEAYSLAKSLDNKHEMAQSLIGLGESQRASGELSASLETFMQAESIANEIGSKNELKESYLGLALTYNKLGKFRDAYRYHTLFSAIKDTIFNTETDDRIKGLQFSYEIDKKQGEIEVLTRDKKLKDL
ncbi:MAG: tetratricopeptide repeat protein, partial [Cyclobacteriaceae bacterium]|nr:tetratricopeptide repeat protein [Cyclobacteriaceae bacterium]